MHIFSRQQLMSVIALRNLVIFPENIIYRLLLSAKYLLCKNNLSMHCSPGSLHHFQTVYLFRQSGNSRTPASADQNFSPYKMPESFSSHSERERLRHFISYYSVLCFSCFLIRNYIENYSSKKYNSFYYILPLIRQSVN